MNIKILVIEDEEAINDVIAMSLRATGYEVVSFLDGDEASASLETGHDYGCAVVDVMLPGKDGFALLPELQKLLIRIDKILKRRGSFQEKIIIYDVVIDREKRVVTKGGQEVYLKPMEFDCLMAFWKRRGRVLTRDQILNMLWGVDFDGESRTVDVHVANIRKKLDFFDVIITAPRVGYRMEV